MKPRQPARNPSTIIRSTSESTGWYRATAVVGVDMGRALLAVMAGNPDHNSKRPHPVEALDATSATSTQTPAPPCRSALAQAGVGVAFGRGIRCACLAGRSRCREAPSGREVTVFGLAGADELAGGSDSVDPCYRKGRQWQRQR